MFFVKYEYFVQVLTVSNYLLLQSTSDLVSKIMIIANYGVEEISCPGFTVSATISHFNGASPGDPVLQLQKQVCLIFFCKHSFCTVLKSQEVYCKYHNLNINRFRTRHLSFMICKPYKLCKQ